MAETQAPEIIPPGKDVVLYVAETQAPEIIPPGKDVVLYVAETPANMFQVASLPELLFKKIEAELAAFKPDLSTAASRQEIASLAFKIVRTKTAVDKAGLQLTEDMREAVKAINAQRTVFKDRFQELQDRARKPLDEWEAAEETRKKAADAIMLDLRNSAIVDINATAAEVRQRIERVNAIVLDFAVLGPDMAITAPHVKQTTIDALKAAYGRLVKAEADAARLKELEEADARRKAAETAEQAAQLAKVAEANAAAAAAEAEEKRLADLAAAEERGRQEAAAAAEAEATRKAEEEAAAKAAEEAAALQRQQDADHREKIVSEAAVDVANLTGLSGKKARELVLSIASNGVRHVKVEF